MAISETNPITLMTVDGLFSDLPFTDRVPFMLFDHLAKDDHLGVLEAETGVRFSYRDIGNRARQIARALHGQRVQAGDRVAWMVPTGIDAISVWMGIAQTGAIDVCIGDALKGKMLEHVLNDSGSGVVIVHASMLGGFAGIERETRARIRAVIVLDAKDKPAGSNEIALTLTNDEASGQERFTPAALAPTQPATITYTSGTTGSSKGVVLCHHHQFFAGANYIEQFRIHKGAIVYHYSPFNHVTGRQLVVAAMLSRSTLVMRSRFSLDLFWTDINRHGITHSITLGSAVPLLLDHSAKEANKGSLRYVWASPAMPQAYAEFARRFGLSVVSPYGSSEVGTVVTPSLIPEEPGPPGNTGRLPKYHELVILDENDQKCPPGVVGEIAVRPRIPWTTFLGYYGRDAVTVETNRNAWYHSGDLAKLDENGYLFFVDRKQDFMRVKGENVSSVELEHILMAHPSVADCCAVPVQSHLAENDILLVVQLSSAISDFNFEEFFAWCARELPHYMVPRYLRTVDQMPRGTSGKIEKHKLRSIGISEGCWDSAAHGLRATRKGITKGTRRPSSSIAAS